MKKTISLLARRTLASNRNIASRDHRWAALCLAGLLSGLAHPARAAVTEAWVLRYSNVVSNSDDYAVKVVRDAAGDIVVTGSTDNGITGPEMLTIKYSGADGSVLWQQRGSGDVAYGVALDGSGNVVVTGISYGNSSSDYYTAKYAAADGALLWEKRYNGPTNSFNSAQAVAVDGSGNVVVTGGSFNGTNGWDYYTAKYAAANGALLWEKRYNGPVNGNDQARAVAVDGGGNVVVTGGSWGGANGNDYYTAKYAAADGALLWENRYNGPANSEDFASAVAVDGSDNVVVTGPSATIKYLANGTGVWTNRSGAMALALDGGGNVVVTGSSYPTMIYDYYTAKYAAADGALLWEHRYNGPANDWDSAQAVAVDGSGNVVVTGYSVGTNENYDYYTAKYAATDGALLWEQRYNGPANDWDSAQAVVVDGSGNVVVTGSSRSSGGLDDAFTAKYAAADGALLWEQRYNNLSRNDDRANAVVVDPGGNIVVTGASMTGYDSWHGKFLYDYYTAKYAAADGARLWERRYNGPANDNDEARAVAVDASGNVVVTGLSDGTNFSTDYYTAKYAAADGALLWERRYNSTACSFVPNHLDFATALALDNSGNVVVTGASGCGGSAAGFLFGFYTAKYAAADGALLWERSSDLGDGRYRDGAYAVAVDSNGNVLVTGSLGLDYYTAKYAAADGAVLWEQRYNGPASSDDRAQAVAVDGNGNVVVTGSSATIKYLANGTSVWTNSGGATALAVDGSGNVVVTGSSYNGTNTDYYTAKYATADGALLWEKRYNGPANDEVVAHAVAVDGNGNVVVTGSSEYDYYTAKYAAADGALLWEKRYNGPANGDDRVGSGRSLTLGQNGMVVVTGSSIGSGGTSDYATVVYWENLPAVAISQVASGIRLSFTGVPGRSYNIERASAVTGPWSTLATPTAPLGGLIEWLDSNPPVSTAFYRTVQP